MSLATADHIAATQMFIDANANQFVLTRPTKVSDGAGGWQRSGQTVLDAQTMRLVGSSLQSAEASVVTADGQTVVPQFALVALPSADMAVGDTFTFEGATHEIVFVSTHPEWRKRAGVYRHA